MNIRHFTAAGFFVLLVAGCTKSSPAPQGPSADASSAETVALKEVTLEVLGMT